MASPYRYIRVEMLDDSVVVTFLALQGDWSQSVGDVLGETARELRELVFPPGCTRVVLDFQGVKLWYSHVMSSALVTLHRRLLKHGGKLTLCDLKPDVFEIMHLSTLDQILHIVPTRFEALSPAARTTTEPSERES